MTEVLVDTGVATWLWMTNTKKSERARLELARFGDELTGKTLLISGQTRAELIQLKLGRDAVNHPSMQTAIDAIPYVPLNRSVQHRYAELWSWARGNSHPIHQSAHAADRWIAASAIEFNLPLASSDGVFKGIPQLLLIAPSTLPASV